MEKQKHINYFLGEFLGTFILVLFGTGSVATSVLFDAHQGLFQIAILWGIGVTLAIYLNRHLSAAHFNPAVSIAMVFSKRMPLKELPTYLAGQFLGAFTAALTIYYFFAPTITAFEKAKNIVRGSFESVTTAKMFGEYYVQPGGVGQVSFSLAFLVELIGTMLLVLFIFFLTEDSNKGRPDGNSAPVFIGLTVASIIGLFAPLTQAGLNPARDFPPRLVSWIFGWKDAAFPDSSGGFFWIYILAPILGGLIAAILFTKLFEPAMKKNK